MKKHYSEEQIIKAIKTRKVDVKVDDISREKGISFEVFYNWPSKYAGFEVNEVKRRTDPEADDNKLKKILTNKLLEMEAMKDVLLKKW